MNRVKRMIKYGKEALDTVISVGLHNGNGRSPSGYYVVNARDYDNIFKYLKYHLLPCTEEK